MFAERKVLELADGVECILLGTLYKEMRLKPSILDEYVKDLDLTRSKVVSAAKFNAPDDSLVLEDEAARVKLAGDELPVDKLVSGARSGRLKLCLQRSLRSRATPQASWLRCAGARTARRSTWMPCASRRWRCSGRCRACPRTATRCLLRRRRMTCTWRWCRACSSARPG